MTAELSTDAREWAQKSGRRFRYLRGLALIPALLVSGCDWVVMSPSGDVALRQRDLVLIATGLMLLIIVPVIALTLIFAFRYRASNESAEYKPDWDHSISLELVIWAVPLLIIIALGAVTWTSTHLLDPYRPLGRISAETKTTGANTPIGQVAGNQQTMQGSGDPLVVQVVSLDWKWLFIYPEQGIATVNELAAPVNRPIRFEMTSSSVMNSFYIPALAGMIYTMPGMETRLHAVINKPGNYEGFSSNYSGAGFSGMRFRFHGVSAGDFDQWVARIKQGGGDLSRARYLQLAKPSEKVPVQRYAGVAPDLYRAILEQCVPAGKPCMSELMHAGGHKAGHEGMVPTVNEGKGPDPASGRPEGALFKNAQEKGEVPHWSDTTSPDAEHRPHGTNGGGH